MVEKKDYKLDIFEVLSQLDKQNYGYYDSLDEEQKKGFVPLVIMRWLSSVEDSGLKPYYLNMVNECVNINFWDLQKHPGLVWKLMCVCGIGAKQRHTWIPKKSLKRNLSKTEELILEYNNCLNDTEIDIVKQKLSKETLKELAYDAGYSDEQTKNVLTEFSGK